MKRIVAIVAILSLFFSLPALAKNSGSGGGSHGNSDSHGSSKAHGKSAAKNSHAEPESGVKGEEPWLKVTITEAESQVLRTYYDPKKQKSLPPGLQKKLARGGSLPPGWQKKLARGEILDAELWGLRQPVPTEILRKLPPQPNGTILIRLEGKIVRLAQATREILDILDL